MNSLLYHDPYHHFHDPTIINVHTLLNPQPYQHPSYINTQSSPFTSYTPLYQQPHKLPTSLVHQNDFSNPPSTLTPSYYNTSLAPSSSPNPYFSTSNYHQQPKTSYSSFPISSPLPNSYPSSATFFHPHGYGYSVEPMAISVFNGERGEDAYSWLLCTEKIFKEQVTPDAMKVKKAIAALRDRALKWWLWRSRRQPPTTTWEAFTTVFLWRFKPEWREILPVDNEEEEEPDLDLSLCNGSSSNVAESTTTMEEDVVVDASFTLNLVPLLVKPSSQGDGETMETQQSITDGEIISTIAHEQEFAVTANLVEPEIKERDEPDEIVVNNDDFTFLAVDSVPQVDKEGKIIVLDLVDVSDHVADFIEKQKQHVNESLTVKPSTEKKVVRAIVVAETPQQHPLFILELSEFSIDIFDPGGMLTVAVYPAVCHHSQIKTSFTFFGYGSRLPNHLVSDKGNFFSSSVKVVPFSDGPASTLPWVPWFRKHNITNGGFDVFDPGGNEYRYRSPAAIDGDNRHTLSLLWLPWDRGKLQFGME